MDVTLLLGPIAELIRMTAEAGTKKIGDDRLQAIEKLASTAYLLSLLALINSLCAQSSLTNQDQASVRMLATELSRVAKQMGLSVPALDEALR